MSEIFNYHNLEQEIAELNRQIETKRQELETKYGVVDDRELTAQVLNDTWKKLEQEEESIIDDELVADRLSSNTTNSNLPASLTERLQALAPETATTIGDLLNSWPQLGLKKTLSRAKNLDPYQLDIFHDLLVDYLYDELRGRGVLE